jgi:hypothetical protein
MLPGMRREIQSIPPAPRQVRWRAVLWHRWVLGLFAFAFGVYGGAVTWMFFLAFGELPSDNARLDAGRVGQATGKVLERIGRGGTLNGKPTDHWRYSFTVPKTDGREREVDLNGSCFAPAGMLQVGKEVQVEFLPDEPNRSRIVGTRLDLLPLWVRPGTWFRLLVVPGLLFLLAWLANAFRLRHMMSLGDVSVAQVAEVREVRWIVPAMLAVRFEFRDHRAAPQEGRHWVRTRSHLGGRLQQQLTNGVLERMPVLHDRRWPLFSRLALPEDFVQPHPASPSRENQPL